ncbi:MAG: type II secretion system protein [Planctomycetota bacterium]|nr:type II secretion system protein [Planctomycetota bacterium]
MVMTRRAFTLVEMLVVTAITVTLLSLLVPAVSSVRASSRSTQCQSQLRSLAAGAAHYAATHHDWFPAAQLMLPADGGGWCTMYWDQEKRSDGSWGPGIIAQFLDHDLQSFQCPCCFGDPLFGEVVTGYNYNTTFVGTEGYFPAPNGNGGWISGWQNARLGVSPGSIRRTNECALFGDAGWAGGTNRFMRAPGNSVEGDLSMVYAGGQSFRHLGGSNVAFLDGHCSTAPTPFRGIHATDEIAKSILDFPKNGFLSDDDSAYDPR